MEYMCVLHYLLMLIQALVIDELVKIWRFQNNFIFLILIFYIYANNSVLYCERILGSVF